VRRKDPAPPDDIAAILTLFVNCRVGLNGQKAALDGDVNALRLNDGQTGSRGEVVAVQGRCPAEWTSLAARRCLNKTRPPGGIRPSAGWLDDAPG